MISRALSLMLLSLLLFIIAGCSAGTRFSENESENSSDNLRESYSGARPVLTEFGEASYYAHKFHGRKTANGEVYNMYDLTAAHISYPFNTIVRITNMNSKKSLILRINDRKPKTNKRVIDVSLKAATELGMIKSGIAPVKIEVLKWGQD